MGTFTGYFCLSHGTFSEFFLIIFGIFWNFSQFFLIIFGIFVIFSEARKNLHGVSVSSTELFLNFF